MTQVTEVSAKLQHTFFLIGFRPISTTQKPERHINAFRKDTQIQKVLYFDYLPGVAKYKSLHH